MGLCKNGVTTKAGCSTVLKLGHCADAICNLVLMEDHITDDGDSGGPWYLGSTAYGIHYGWDYDPFWPFDRSAFSRADRLDNALFITVATS